MSLFDLRAKYQAGTLKKPDYIAQMYQQHKQLFEYSHFIQNTDIEKIEIIDGSLTITFRKTGIKMVCQHPDQRMAPIETLNFGFYEKEITQMVLQLAEPGFTIFDIGANMGWYTLNLAHQFRKSQVFAFEPIPSTFKALKANIQLNKMDNIEPYNLGFSNQEGKLDFYLDPEMSVSASLENICESKNAQKVSCQVQKLDDFVRENKLRKLDFIKCDVEGAELKVYEGGLESLKKYKPILLSEMLRKWSKKFNYNPNDIIQLLSKMGYRCFTVKDQHLAEFFEMTEDTQETNFFFLHSTKHVSKIKSLLKATSNA